jgi:hypothetical protein
VLEVARTEQDVTAGRPASFSAVYNGPISDVASFSWDFGDSQPATGTAASHVFAGAGPASVTLTARFKDNTESAATSRFTVLGTVVPTLGILAAPDAPVTGETVRLEAIYTGAPSDISEYRWSFGDGAAAGGSPAEHQYANAGDYVVTLTGVRAGAPPLDAAATMHVSVANSVLTIADPATRARVYAGRLPAWSLAGVGPLLEEAFRGPIADVEAGRISSSARAEDLLSKLRASLSLVLEQRFPPVADNLATAASYMAAAVEIRQAIRDAAVVSQAPRPARMSAFLFDSETVRLELSEFTGTYGPPGGGPRPTIDKITDTPSSFERRQRSPRRVRRFACPYSALPRRTRSN